MKKAGTFTIEGNNTPIYKYGDSVITTKNYGREIDEKTAIKLEIASLEHKKKFLEKRLKEINQS
jgi:hypothetical protein